MESEAARGWSEELRAAVVLIRCRGRRCARVQTFAGDADPHGAAGAHDSVGDQFREHPCCLLGVAASRGAEPFDGRTLSDRSIRWDRLLSRSIVVSLARFGVVTTLLPLALSPHPCPLSRLLLDVVEHVEVGGAAAISRSQRSSTRPGASIQRSR